MHDETHSAREAGDLARTLLRIDGLGGLLVGIVVIAGHRWLAQWYQLPEGVLLFTAAANLMYGTYATLLEGRSVRPVAMIAALALANMAWAVACGTLIVRWGSEASLLGVVHLALEGLYVGGLGALEWRWRRRLAVDPSGSAAG